jgi:hypothetical protein
MPGFIEMYSFMRRGDRPCRADEYCLQNSTGDPDLVLIYRKPDDYALQFIRLESHSELGWDAASHLCERQLG